MPYALIPDVERNAEREAFDRLPSEIKRFLAGLEIPFDARDVEAALLAGADLNYIKHEVSLLMRQYYLKHYPGIEKFL